MARKRQLSFGAINITMTAPHRPQRYIDLFEIVRNLDLVIRLRGDWVGRIGSIKLNKFQNGESYITGDFYKYLELDSTKDWFNVLRGKRAEQTELEAIKIPEHLKPHFQFVPYVFFPKGHRLILVTKDGDDFLSSAQAAAILKAIFRSSEVLNLFSEIEVTVEPARETLDKIFKLPQLRSLEVVVKPPNPDDFEEFEQDLYEEMANQGAGSYQIKLQAANNQGLTPNDNTKNLARVAQSNGKVTGVGKVGAKTVTLSTTEHPYSDSTQYDPSVEIRSHIVLKKAIEIFDKLKA